MLFCAACSDEVVVTEKPQTPWVAPASTQVGAAAGSQVFELREVLPEATIASDQTWCTPSIDGTKISVAYTQNDRNATRTAILTVTQKGATPPLATIALVQSRASISLTDAQDIISLKASAEAVTVGVQCDVQWTAHSNADWLTLTPAEGGGDLLITPEQNPSGEIRKERVTLSVGEITQSFTVEQQGAILTIDSPAVDLYAVATGRILDVASNVEWEVASNASWLTAANIEGKLSLTPTANDGASRSTDVFLTAGTLRKTVKVTQRSLYESMLGTWTLSCAAYVVKDGSIINKAFKVTLLEDTKNESFLLNGLGTDYLATTTEAPVTVAFDAAAYTATITAGEEIGTFEFMGFTQDPENKAIVKSVFLQVTTAGGKTSVTPVLTGGELLTGAISEDLNLITFEADRGIGFGMWINSTGAWSGSFCSYRMFEIALTREVSLESPAAGPAINRFYYVGR